MSGRAASSHADEERLADRLAQMVRVATVSPEDDGPLTPDTAAVFAEFRALLTRLYPGTFAAASLETVGRAGLLLRIAGDAGAPARGATGLGDVVLMAHQDVVPAPDVHEDWAAAGWSHPPFAGTVADGPDGLTVYGRGTLDDKGALLALLEAVEALLGEGWRPRHDLYLLLGADEERDGHSAVAATDLLEARGVRPALVVDEGGAVVTGAFPGLRRPMAVVGLAEKGVVTAEIVVRADPRHPAHASTPPRHGVAAALGRALIALERSPHPAVVDDVTVAMFTRVAPHLPVPLRQLAARADAARGLLAHVLPLVGPEMNALVRTTATATMLRGSAAPNVIAASASAVVNLRVATSSSADEAVAHLLGVVQRAVDGRGIGRVLPGPLGRRGRGRRPVDVAVRVIEASEPTPASPMSGEVWDVVQSAATTAYPEAVVVPYTMLAASDSRHVARIAPAVYRFSPLAMSAEQRASVHGVDEYATAASLVAGVRFYRTLLRGTGV